MGNWGCLATGAQSNREHLKNPVDPISELSAEDMEEIIFIYWFPNPNGQGLPQGPLTFYVQFEHAAEWVNRLVSCRCLTW